MSRSRSQFSYHVGGISKQEWHDLLETFDDAHLCQTWSYGTARWGSSNLVHFILKRDGQTIGAAQIVVMRVPFLRAGLAYVKWGPMWRLRGQAPYLESFAHLARAIREHYVCEKGYLLRLMPREIEGDTFDPRKVLEREGFRWRGGAGGTWLVDLSRPLDDLRAGLRRNWRSSLKRADRGGIEIHQLSGPEGLDLFIRMYEEMRRRKSFIDQSDISYFKSFQSELPDALKLKIFAAWHQGEAVSAVAVSAIGETGTAVFGATSPEGRQVGASYALDWSVITWLKEQGYRHYDLGGAGDANVNVYKGGMAGKGNQPVRYIGKFESSKNLPSSLAVRSIDALRATKNAKMEILSRTRRDLRRR